MRLSRQARLNILQPKLHNAYVIRTKLNSFRAEFRIDECKEALKSGEKPAADTDFARAFEELRGIKDAFRENRPLEKQDGDTLWADYLDCSNTVYELNKRIRQITSEETEKAAAKITALLDAMEEKHVNGRPTGGQIFWQDCEEIINAFREAGGALHFRQQEELWERYRNIRNLAGKRRREQKRKRIEGKAKLTAYIKNRIQVQEEYLAGVIRDLDGFFEKQGSSMIGPDAPKWVIQKAEKKAEVTEELKALRTRLSKLEP